MSKAFNVSVDEILDNDSKEFLMNKISNTERLAGIIIKILKVIGFVFIGYIIFMIIAVIGLGTYTVVKKIMLMWKVVRQQYVLLIIKSIK